MNNFLETTIQLNTLFNERHIRLNRMSTDNIVAGDFTLRSPRVLQDIEEAIISNRECEHELRARFLNHEQTNH